MKTKSPKQLIDIRVKRQVAENSFYDWLHRYLNDDNATPYVKQQLILDSLANHYSPLVYQYQGATEEEIRNCLVDTRHLWELHFHYLQQRLGIYVDAENPQNVVKQEVREVSSPQKSEAEVVSSSQQVSLIEEKEEGKIYPEVF